jgi:Flp pilus assembly protein TadD
LQEAIAELRRGVELSGGSPVYVASLAHACGLAGRADEARRLIDELQKLSQRKYVASVDIAAAFLGLGEKNQALTLLEKAVQERSPRLLFLGVDPRFDVLRSDARFQLLANRVVPSN